MRFLENISDKKYMVGGKRSEAGLESVLCFVGGTGSAAWIQPAEQISGFAT